MNTFSASLDAVFRNESGRILASLIRYSGSFDLAEEALQDACEIAARTWPSSGVPGNPGAWLTAAARRRLIDAIRRDRLHREKGAELLATTPTEFEMPDPEVNDLPDDRLRLIFTCCHPALNPEAQLALTLRTLGGLSTDEIARAFLIPEATLAQRLVRAKTKIRQAGIPYEVPSRDRIAERSEAVRVVIYLIFNEGYAATFAPSLVRADLCAEAIRLARVLCELLPVDPENRGLLALMLLQDSRRAARTDDDGNLVTLDEQDRSKWNPGKIIEALALLMRSAPAHGRYTLEARIAAEHARSAATGETDWAEIARLYTDLCLFCKTPVVELNRAVAVAMSEGLESGLALMDQIPGLESFHLFHAARADLLRRLDRHHAALAAYSRALELVTNPVERAYLQRRIGALDSTGRVPPLP